MPSLVAPPHRQCSVLSPLHPFSSMLSFHINITLCHSSSPIMCSSLGPFDPLFLLQPSSSAWFILLYSYNPFSIVHASNSSLGYLTLTCSYFSLLGSVCSLFAPPHPTFSPAQFSLFTQSSLCSLLPVLKLSHSPLSTMFPFQSCLSILVFLKSSPVIHFLSYPLCP